MNAEAALVTISWLFFVFVGIGLSAWMVHRIWRRRNDLGITTKVILALVAAAVMGGAFGTVAGLVKTFGAVGGESVDPSQKARILAEGISEAMNCTAFGIVVWVPSMIAAFVITRGSKAPQ